MISENGDTPDQFSTLTAAAANGITITRAHLSKALHLELGLPQADSLLLLEQVLEAIAVGLENGQTVKIGRFGTFTVRQKAQRVGRNPKTGLEAAISPRAVIVFRPSLMLKAIMNGAVDPGEDDADE
jgi:integration host factor subunit alpha